MIKVPLQDESLNEDRFPPNVESHSTAYYQELLQGDDSTLKDRRHRRCKLFPGCVENTINDANN